MPSNCNNSCLYKLFLFVTAVSAGVTMSICWYWKQPTVPTLKTEFVPKSSFMSQPLVSQRGNYWVLYDFIKRGKQFGYNDSVTYATHGEFPYFENIIEIAESWQGPVSVSVYCPGTDYDQALRRIQYLRQCFPIVQQLVSFHLLFDLPEVPKTFTPSPWKKWESSPVQCKSPSVFKEKVTTYRQTKKLLYPINIARNIAREMSPTYYVLMTDIELFTRPLNLIPDFLEMIRKNEKLRKSPNQVFVLPIFEVDKSVTKLPSNKLELQSLLGKNLSVFFHQYYCSSCHKIPHYEKWVHRHVSTGLQVFRTAKRSKKYRGWEPLYIGTNYDPIYDERLTREGEAEKMGQAFVMCLLDYNFHILDNAFLVHRPGIKQLSTSTKSNKKEIEKTNALRKRITIEKELLYGRRRECGHA